MMLVFSVLYIWCVCLFKPLWLPPSEVLFSRDGYYRRSGFFACKYIRPFIFALFNFLRLSQPAAQINTFESFKWLCANTATLSRTLHARPSKRALLCYMKHLGAHTSPSDRWSHAHSHIVTYYSAFIFVVVQPRRTFFINAENSQSTVSDEMQDIQAMFNHWRQFRTQV